MRALPYDGMKIKKRHISGYLKLLISIACMFGILVIGWFMRKNLQPTPSPSQEIETPQTHHKKRKKKASKSTSTESTQKKRTKRNNKKRPVSASRRKKAEQDAAERKANLECLLYEDGI